MTKFASETRQTTSNSLSLLKRGVRKFERGPHSIRVVHAFLFAFTDDDIIERLKLTKILLLRVANQICINNMGHIFESSKGV